MTVKDNPNNKFISKEEFIANRKKEKKIAAELKAHEEKLIKEYDKDDVEETSVEETSPVKRGRKPKAQ